ncbi:hypothetical protein ACFFMP_04695 [Pseudoroseomonas cervicalis]
MPPDHMPPATPLSRPGCGAAAPGSPTLLFLHGAGCGAWVSGAGLRRPFLRSRLPAPWCWS